MIPRFFISLFASKVVWILLGIIGLPMAACGSGGGESPAAFPKGDTDSTAAVSPAASVPSIFAREAKSADVVPPVYLEHLFEFAQTPMGPTVVHVTVPVSASPNDRFPVLIALHGQGEARKSPEDGAMGWPYDYGMLRAMERFNGLPLHRSDFLEMIRDERLALFNQSLRTRPYRGLIVVCPYYPDRFGRHLRKDARVYGQFITQTLLPRVYAETPAIGTPETTAIDGVSLGGRVAVVVGLSHPGNFGAVGGIQAAFSTGQVSMVAALLKNARKTRPDLAFRLMSSQKDVFKEVTKEISGRLRTEGMRHQMDIVEGNHSYEFNRGPGVYEMLLYYDRVLRGEGFL